jgi:hypothetical protein
MNTVPVEESPLGRNVQRLPGGPLPRPSSRRASHLGSSTPLACIMTVRRGPSPTDSSPLAIAVAMTTVLLFSGSGATAHVAPAPTSAPSTAAELIGSDKKPFVVRFQSAANSTLEAAAEREDRRRSVAANWWMVGLTVVLALLAGAQLVVTAITLRGLKYARTAAEAAKAAAEATSAQIEMARKTYFTENRPWVALTDLAIKALGLRQGAGPRIEIVLHLQNTGRTPAHALHVDALFSAEGRPEASVARLRHRFESDTHAQSTDGLTCILPGQTIEIPLAVMSLAGSLDAIPAENGERALIFTLAGEVTYRSDSIENAKVHATSFVYRIARRNNRHIRWGGEQALIDGEELQVVRWPGGWLCD